MSPLLKSIIAWILIFGTVLLFVTMYLEAKEKERTIEYSAFLDKVEAGEVEKVLIRGNTIRGSYVPADAASQGERFSTHAPDLEGLVAILRTAKVAVASEEDSDGVLGGLITALPFVILIGIWIFFMRQMQGSGQKAMSFGKSRARLLSSHQKKVTFKDVAGCDESKEELQEIIEFLRDPQKFARLGGKMPKGVLLIGQPGTGKTLMARAVAGEADVPFFSLSGSDFVEMFVGVGASRVRDLFEQGKKNAPCLIFIDEIDAVGRHRGAGLGGGHDEREQTLNALLVEMDGFETNEGVIIIAATNRPDVLDRALLRPGRFDRQVSVGLPDASGRLGILKVHTRKVPLADDVDLKLMARATPGMSGADLANLVNEAALLAARANLDAVTHAEFESARDKVIMGLARRNMVISEKERKVTAFHEAGHALTAALTPKAQPVHKVTIIPHAQALGVTQFVPDEERHTWTASELRAQVRVLLGGRAAEQLIFEEHTTGAADDIKKTTDIARRMVSSWGMSERLGPLGYAEKDEQVFLGRDIARAPEYSAETAKAIDEEVKSIVDEAWETALGLLRDNREVLTAIAEALLERETLDATEFAALVAGETLPPLPEPEAVDEGANSDGEPAKTAEGDEADDDDPDGSTTVSQPVLRPIEDARVAERPDLRPDPSRGTPS